MWPPALLQFHIKNAYIISSGYFLAATQMSNLAYMYKMLGQLDKAPVDGKGEEHGKIRLKAGKCCVSYLFIFFPAPVLEIISDNSQ